MISAALSRYVLLPAPAPPAPTGVRRLRLARVASEARPPASARTREERVAHLKRVYD